MQIFNSITRKQARSEDLENLEYPTSINGRAIFKILLPLGVRVIRRWRPRLAPRVFRLTPNYIVKYGACTISEAFAMDYVSKNTSLSLPRVITAFQVKSGACYILMTRCPGVPLCNVFSTLPEKERANILLQLRGLIDELRALRPAKPGVVGSADYRSLHDDRIHASPCGPFGSVAEFHASIRGGVEYPTGHEEADRMITAQNSRDYSIKFTHGDLSFRNIIYEDGNITGIVDWESAGWFPDYWEYTMTWDSFWDNPDLRGDIDTFLEPFPEELKVEQTRRRLFSGK